MLNDAAGATARRCAVWGSPVDHSLSPVLHLAAYEALGITDWEYDRREVDEASFPAALAGLDASWAGLSLTMPLKEAALAAADTVSRTATATGAANTLVRDGSGWSAHNTDVEGIRVAVAEHGLDEVRSAVVVGSGATARSALLALSSLGLRQVAFAVRGEVRPDTLRLAGSLDVAVEVMAVGDWPQGADVVLSTVPPSALDVTRFPDAPDSAARADPAPVAAAAHATRDTGSAEAAPRPRAVLDVVYGSGRTPLQEVAEERGWVVVPGTDMLLHQAAAQVRLMTGRDAPVEAMRAALAAALGPVR